MQTSLPSIDLAKYVEARSHVALHTTTHLQECEGFVQSPPRIVTNQAGYSLYFSLPNHLQLKAGLLTHPFDTPRQRFYFAA